MQRLSIKDRVFEMDGPVGDNYWDSLAAHLKDDPLVGLADVLCDKQSTVLDIGANIGVMTLAFSEMAKRVISFEPVPTTCSYLQRNVAQNGIGNVTVVNAACGKERSSLSMHAPAGGSAQAFVLGPASEEPVGGTTVVSQIKLDEYVREHNVERIDFIKIDVEGFEQNVLEGAEETLRRFEPAVYVEFNTWCLIDHARMLPTDFFAYLKSLFPVMGVMTDTGVTLLGDAQAEQSFLHQNITRFGGLNDVICFVKSADPRIGRLGSVTRENAAKPRVVYRLGETLPFNRVFSGTGWSGAEASGSWSNATRATVELYLDEGTTGAVELACKASAYLPNPESTQTVRVSINGRPVGVWEFNVSNNHATPLIIPAGVLQTGGPVEIGFDISNPVQPSAIGRSTDTRELGIFVESLTVSPPV